MRTLKGPLNYLNSWPTPKNTSFLFVMFFFCFGGLSCRDKDESYSQPLAMDNSRLSASTESLGTQFEDPSTGLFNLYLENFRDAKRNQLTGLLSEENYKKLVFQFYRLRDGRLTLAAFAGKQNDKNFNPNYQILRIVDDEPIEDIEGKEVFLGSQVLENDALFKTLKDAVNEGSKNDTSKNYVLFTPELKRFSESGNYVIEYSIRFTNSLQGLSSQILPVRSGRLNPSPPY